jgi:hypothetical protein
MVSLCDAISMSLRRRSARRVVRTGAAGGVRGGMPRLSACFFGRGWGGMVIKYILTTFNTD